MGDGKRNVLTYVCEHISDQYKNCHQWFSRVLNAIYTSMYLACSRVSKGKIKYTGTCGQDAKQFKKGLCNYEEAPCEERVYMLVN